MMLAVGSECIFCQDLEAAYLIHPICRQYPPHTLANPVPTGKPIFPVIVLLHFSIRISVLMLIPMTTISVLNSNQKMDGWMMDWMMDGWVGGWMDGWMDKQAPQTLVLRLSLG